MAQLKVLISGGGVAGTSLAFWLSKLGHDVTVVEWFPSLRTTGLQIDLRGHGIEVLRRMGLEQAFRDRAAPEDGMAFIDAAGKVRAYLAANKTGKGPQGITSEFEIMRGDLCRIIFDGTEDRAKYVFGTSIASFKNEAPGVEVTFKNGNTEHFDLLVGADGAWSATRKLMIGRDAAAAAFTSAGEFNAYMTLPRPMQEGERYDGKMYLATNKRGILVRRHNKEQIQLYLLLSRKDERLAKVRRGDVVEEKAAFTEVFKDAGWEAPELLNEMQGADDFYCERIGLVRLDAWSQGNVALIGDAAWCPGGSGMGTTCAMVGAYVLAGEIGKHCGLGGKDAKAESHPTDGLATALKSFETNFRPYMNHIQKGLEQPPSWLMPSTAFGIAILHWFLAIVAYLLNSPLVGWFTKYLTKEKIEGWQIPEYEEMRRIQAEIQAKKG